MSVTVLSYLHSIYPLSEQLGAYLMEKLSVRQVQKKEYLLKAGHICRHICFIDEGLFRCFYFKEEQEICSWFMKEGDIIISVESFFYQQPSYESIQALEDSQVSYIDYSTLQYIYRQFPEFNSVARLLTEKYYCMSEQRLYAIRMQRAQERYDYLMEHFPELILRVPAKYLASYLGITEVTFSKIKSRF